MEEISNVVLDHKMKKEKFIERLESKLLKLKMQEEVIDTLRENPSAVFDNEEAQTYAKTHRKDAYRAKTGYQKFSYMTLK